MEAHTVQPIPGTVDIDAQEAVESMPDVWGSLIIPVIISVAGGGMIGHLMRGWIDAKGLVRQEISEMRERLEMLSERVQRLEHTGSRKARIAHLSLDRVQDWEQYFLRRDETRAQEDPDGSLTPWVPALPPRLRDDSWVIRHREELLELDTLDTD